MPKSLRIVPEQNPAKDAKIEGTWL